MENTPDVRCTICMLGSDTRVRCDAIRTAFRAELRITSPTDPLIDSAVGERVHSKEEAMAEAIRELGNLGCKLSLFDAVGLLDEESGNNILG